MRISIDTAQDSREDIRKAIRLLQALVEHDASQGSKNIFDNPSPDLFGSSAPAQESNPVSAFGNLFGDNAPAPATGAPAVPEEKKGDDVPEVEWY